MSHTAGVSGVFETSGILDISNLVGYQPGSVLLTSNQGFNSSLSVLVSPAATPLPEPTSLALCALGFAALSLVRYRSRP